mmetsp:Transcript_80132/g.159910  ORF Transcript_80132/g.159910 Transcript_80132/m.159910 type:complete len:468 (-) Transcript_80132:130-1533(-)
MESDAGGEHSLIKTTKGKVFSAGACGLGWCRTLEDFGASLFGWRAVPLPEPARSILGSYYHNLAIGASTGKLYAWGCGTFTGGGRDGVIPALGLPPAATSHVVEVEDVGGEPHEVALPAGQSATSLAAGAFHSVVLTQTGGVLTFGAAQLGQLGRFSALTSSIRDSSGLPVDPRPLPVEGLPDPRFDPPVAIGAGFYNTLVACRSGALYCSGENQNGQCGVAPVPSTATTTPPLPAAAAAERAPDNLPVMTRCSALGKDLKAVAAAGGYCHTLVLAEDGSVVSMGCADDGQRGDGLNGDDSNRPTISKVVLPGNKRATAVACGANHSVVLASDGTAYAFGSNEYGQCGGSNSFPAINDEARADGSDTPTVQLSPLPINMQNVGPNSKIVAVSAGYAHTVLRDDQGNVYTCGQNENGQLGIGEVAAKDPSAEAKTPGLVFASSWRSETQGNGAAENQANGNVTYDFKF